jgi:hypothetical protein
MVKGGCFDLLILILVLQLSNRAEKVKGSPLVAEL